MARLAAKRWDRFIGIPPAPTTAGEALGWDVVLKATADHLRTGLVADAVVPASADPFARSPAFRTAIHDASTRDIWPAPIASDRSPRA